MHAYLRDNFFGSIRATCQCESINLRIRAKVHKKNSLIESMLSHFCAMKHEHLDSIPSSSICKRWTKLAKSEFICSTPAEETNTEKMARLQFGSLMADCNMLNHLAAKDIDDFVQIREDILKHISRLQLRND